MYIHSQRNSRLQRESLIPVYYSVTCRYPNLPQISKRLAVRLEDELRDGLEMLCKYEKITPETFLEAALIICNSNPGTMALVLAEAKNRYTKRKIAGELRRLKTINQKYQRT